MEPLIRYNAGLRRWIGQDGKQYLNSKAGLKAARLAVLKAERPDLYAAVVTLILNQKLDSDAAIKAGLALRERRPPATEAEKAVALQAGLPDLSVAFDLLIVTKRYGFATITRGDEPILWVKFARRAWDEVTYTGLKMTDYQVVKLLEKYAWVKNENRQFELIRKYRRIST